MSYQKSERERVHDALHASLIRFARGVTKDARAVERGDMDAAVAIELLSVYVEEFMDEAALRVAAYD